MRIRPGEINILCRDAAASLRFYRDVLGFTFVEEDDGATRLSCDGRHFLLLPFAPEPRPEWPYGSRPEISFDLHVDDLPAAVAHLRAHGVRFARPWSRGDRSAIVRDPDGLVIEILGP